jgi:PAS domain S-box-containing protein
LKQEIAERRRAEDELKTSAEIVRAIPSGLFIYQYEPPDRLILLHGNSEAEELTGIQLSQWHGREFNEIWPQAQSSGVTKAFLNVLKTGKIFETEDLYYKDTRMEGAFKLRVFPMPKKRLGVAFESILERKRAEEMLDRFFNLTPDMFFIADFTGELHRVNPAFKKILGYDHQELIARSCFDFVHPDDKASTLKAAEKLIHGESMLNFENRILCKNGDYRWLQWTALPDFEKEVVYGIARDITAQKQAEYDHKKLESQLRQAYKMEAIGTLAGGIAHDFNNILGAVIGYTEMTLSQLPQQDSLSRNLQEVLTAGHRARDLVKQILTFSRQAEQQLQPVQVRLIAQEAVKLLRASLPTTIEIRQHIDSDKTVLADPTQVHQIIMNLCTNAGFAMREKGGILGLSLADMVLDGEVAAEYPDLPDTRTLSAADRQRHRPGHTR